jgi:hypothetical protein
MALAAKAHYEVDSPRSIRPITRFLSGAATMSATARPIRRLAPLVLSAAILFALAGCASVTPIGELLDNSARYDGQTVRIEGEVRESGGGFGLGAYQVKDETGTLTVLSEKSGPPRTGAKIGVKGRFEALLTLGSKSLAVLREESRSVP